MWVLACPCLAHLACTCACMCGSFTLPWWGSWPAVGGGLFNILIWHVLTGNALPSYSTDSHCSGNRSLNPHTNVATLNCVVCNFMHARLCWGDVLSELVLGLVWTEGWTVGVWSAVTREAKTHKDRFVLTGSQTSSESGKYAARET